MATGNVPANGDSVVTVADLDTKVSVECQHCATLYECEAGIGSSEDSLDSIASALTSDGWRVRNEDELICPQCQPRPVTNVDLEVEVYLECQGCASDWRVERATGPSADSLDSIASALTSDGCRIRDRKPICPQCQAVHPVSPVEEVLLAVERRGFPAV